MSWKFWKKDSNKKNEKLAGPRDIPAVVGRHLVIHMHKDPDWVWGLKCVVRQQKFGKPQVFNVRVFDEKEANSKKVKVKNFRSLDDHSDLILFEGWFDKSAQRAQIEEIAGCDAKAA